MTLGVDATGWTAVGAIGQCLGAAATFLAVLVALRTAQASGRVQLKISGPEKNTAGGIWCVGDHSDRNDRSRTRLTFRAVNDGPRPVEIIDAGIVLPNGDE